MDDFNPFHQHSSVSTSTLATAAMSRVAGVDDRSVVSSIRNGDGDEKMDVSSLSSSTDEAPKKRKRREGDSDVSVVSHADGQDDAAMVKKAIDGNVRRSLRTRMWTSVGREFIDTPSFWPEVEAGLVPESGSIAVAFAGGGTRAMAAGMGQFRALNSLGWTSKINLTSTSSGGTWCNTIFTYYSKGAKNDAELLGPPTDPCELTPEALAVLPECRLAYGTTVDFQANYERLSKAKVPILDLWYATVEETYLKRFGICVGNHMTYDPKTWDDIVTDNPCLRGEQCNFVHGTVPGIESFKDDPRRPYPIFNQSLIGPIPQGVITKSWEVFIWNTTPLYVGVPYHQNVDYKALYGWLLNQTQSIGGGLVEPFAIDGGAPLFPAPSIGKIASATGAGAGAGTGESVNNNDELRDKDPACEIVVETGDVWFAGSGARVFIVLHGEEGDSAQLELSRDHAVISPEATGDAALFSRGETSTFRFFEDDAPSFASIGKVKSVSLQHDGSGWGSGWYLANIAVRFPAERQGFDFACHRWLNTADKEYCFGEAFAIAVRTADVAFGGTSAPVSVRISYGPNIKDTTTERIHSEVVQLDKSHASAEGGKLKRGSFTVFTFTAEELFPNGRLGAVAGRGWEPVAMTVSPGKRFGQFSGWFMRYARVIHGGISTAFPANSWIDTDVIAELVAYDTKELILDRIDSGDDSIAKLLRSSRTVQILSPTSTFSAAESAGLSGGYGGLWSWFPPDNLRCWIDSQIDSTSEYDRNSSAVNADGEGANGGEAEKSSGSENGIEANAASRAGTRLGAEFVGIVDSGFIDNSGLITCLQRRQTKILYFNNTETPLNLDYDPTKPPLTEFDSKSFAASVLDCTIFLPPLFGFSKDDPTSVSRDNQVFPQEDWAPLITKLQAKMKAGEPAVVAARHKVLRNDRFRIEGGWDVTVVWIYMQSEPGSRFESLLPKATRDMINLGRPWPKTKVPTPPSPENPFPYFPNYITESGVNKGKPAQFTNEMVNLLASYNEWTIFQNKDIIEEALFK